MERIAKFIGGNMESRREYYRRLMLFAIDQLENLKNAFPDKVAQFYVDNNGVHAYIDYEMFNENFPVDKEEKIFDDIKKYESIVEKRLYDDCSKQELLEENSYYLKQAIENNIKLYVLSDVHLGDPNCDIDTLKNIIEFIKILRYKMTYLII